jgi:PAS domain S-box-containing protein
MAKPRSRLSLSAVEAGGARVLPVGAVVAFTTDADGRIQSWNREAQALFGYSSEDLRERSWGILIAAEPGDASPSDAQAGSSTAVVRRFRRRDGREFVARHASIPLTTAEGNVGYAQVIITGSASDGSATADSGSGDTVAISPSTRHAELRYSEEARVRLLRRLVVAQEEERRRIARDLHDHLGQQLTALRLKLESVQNAAADVPSARAPLVQAADLLTQIDRDIDFLSWELRPAALDEFGLTAVLDNYVKEWSRYSQVPARFHADRVAEIHVPPEIESTLYRIVQEALNNVARHARARAVSVVLEKRGGTMSLVIEDDGVGFDASTISNTMIGLVSMRERAAVVGGTLDIEPTAGGGTTVFARVPLALTDHGANDRSEPQSHLGDNTAEDLSAAHALGRTAELQRAVAARDDFIATVAHELRNPIAPLLFQIRMVNDKMEQMERAGQPVSGEWAGSQLRRIENRVHRLLETLDRLLDVSRLSSGRVDLECDSVDLSEIISDVLVSFEAELAVARCEVRLTIPSPVIGWWDRMRLDQIGRNLVSNAIRFGAGHPIHVTVEENDGEARLIVQDHGIGIPAHKQQVIFERFERGPETTRSGGFGVGLWVVRNLCLAMGGSISVESSVGTGSTFVVTLPQHRYAEQRRGENE